MGVSEREVLMMHCRMSVLIPHLLRRNGISPLSWVHHDNWGRREHVPVNDSYHGFIVVKVHEAYAAARQIAVVVDSALLSGFDSALLKGLL